MKPRHSAMRTAEEVRDPNVNGNVIVQCSQMVLFFAIRKLRKRTTTKKFAVQGHQLETNRDKALKRATVGEGRATETVIIIHVRVHVRYPIFNKNSSHR